MILRRFVLTLITGAMLAAVAAPAFAQEIVVTGPPPELRAHLEALQKAFNSGSSEAWEAMAKTAFTPELLKKQTAADRKAAYTKMRADFGTIAIERVERNGPDSPLQVFLKGSVASGVLWIDLDEASKFESLKPEVHKKLDEDRCH